MNLKRFFCSLSGDDYSMIIKCNDRSLETRFTLIGIFVAAIFLLCFISCYYSFTKLFKFYIIGVPFSLFFSWMITNIYLLLLYTLTKNTFPVVTNNVAKYFSISIRLIFIAFIAVIISQPIETFIFSKYLSEDIELYKKEQILKYTISTNEYFEKETKIIKLIIDKQKKLYKSSPIGNVENYENLISKKDKQKKNLIASMESLVNKSNYYIQSINILNNKYRGSWVLTIIFIIIFLSPAYLKELMREENNYYTTKKIIEMRIVNEEYSKFKEKYNTIFLNLFNEDIVYSEPYLDAPYNTLRKVDVVIFLKEDELISDLYDA